MEHEAFLEQFSLMRDHYHKNDELREEIIKVSRDILKKAKHAIYETHQGNTDKAQKLIQEALATYKSVELTHKDALHLTGALGQSAEELLEAQLFTSYVAGEKLPLREELSVDIDTYIGAVSDFTGELSRLATKHAISNNTENIVDIRNLIEKIQGQLLQFHLRNGHARKKYDQIQNNLHRVEQTLYDVRLHGTNKNG